MATATGEECRGIAESPQRAAATRASDTGAVSDGPDEHSSPELFAYLSYADGPVGIGWLEAIGFHVTARQDGEHGDVLHAELRLGRVVVMVASFDQAYEVPALRGRSVGRGLYVLTESVDELYQRGVAAGGEPVIAPEDTEWGSRRARLLDPGGHEWSFGTYRPGVAT